MAYVITDKCLSCGTCYYACPNEAIENRDEVYVIDKKKCDGCGECAKSCPCEAIEPVNP